MFLFGTVWTQFHFTITSVFNFFLTHFIQSFFHFCFIISSLPFLASVHITVTHPYLNVVDRLFFLNILINIKETFINNYSVTVDHVQVAVINVEVTAGNVDEWSVKLSP